MFQADSSASSVQIALRGTDQVDAARFRHLREDVPFNRFMSELIKSGELHLDDVDSSPTFQLTNLIE